MDLRSITSVIPHENKFALATSVLTGVAIGYGMTKVCSKATDCYNKHNPQNYENAALSQHVFRNKIVSVGFAGSLGLAKIISNTFKNCVKIPSLVACPSHSFFNGILGGLCVYMIGKAWAVNQKQIDKEALALI